MGDLVGDAGLITQTLPAHTPPGIWQNESSRQPVTKRAGEWMGCVIANHNFAGGQRIQKIAENYLEIAAANLLSHDFCRTHPQHDPN